MKPRLHLKETLTPSPEHAPKEEITVEDEEEEIEDEEEERNRKLPPKMQATLRPVDASNEASSMSDDDSNFPPSEDSQQPVYGPAAKEENTKMGFSGLKLGKIDGSQLGIIIVTFALHKALFTFDIFTHHLSKDD